MNIVAELYARLYNLYVLYTCVITNQEASCVCTCNIQHMDIEIKIYKH